VEELCRHFNIQTANPCAVLTQDHAKKKCTAVRALSDRYNRSNIHLVELESTLASLNTLYIGNELALYEFFLEAVNLKDIQDDLLATRAALDTMEEQIGAFQLKMPEYEEVAVKAQADFDGAVALRKLNTDRGKLERLLVWSCFNDRERRIDKEECEEAKARESINIMAKEQRNANDEQRKLQMQLAAATSEKDGLFCQLEDISKHGKWLKDNNIKEKKELKHAERALQSAADEIEQAKEHRAQAQKRLDEQLTSLKANQKSQRAQIERERAHLDGEVADLESALKVAE
jgi:chromosome segregation ATPase